MKNNRKGLILAGGFRDKALPRDAIDLEAVTAHLRQAHDLLFIKHINVSRYQGHFANINTSRYSSF